MGSQFLRKVSPVIFLEGSNSERYTKHRKVEDD